MLPHSFLKRVRAPATNLTTFNTSTTVNKNKKIHIDTNSISLTCRFMLSAE